MAVFPVQAFTKNDVNVAWKASYTSESLNKKFNGLPPGVYLGLTPASVPGSDILTLSVDATRGISVAAMKATGSNTTVHLQVENVVSLDFTGHVAYPVYVVAKASYAAGVTTSASIETQAAPPNGVDTVGICRIDAMGLVPVIASSAAPDRHEPLANTGVAFGFMRGGDIQNVDANNATTVDVNNAKVDTQSVVHPTLTARLAEDFSGAGLSKNLARTLEVIQGNQISIGAVGSANVSGSFAKFDRDVAPAINIATGGSESADGAVTSGSHPLGRNVVYLRDRSRNKIVTQVGGFSLGVYGRLSAATLALAGTLSFTAASTAVTGIGTQFLTECEVGDIIKGADNDYYEIASIIDDFGLTLSTAYQGATVAGATSDRRRFTVTFHYEAAGFEGPYTFPAGVNNIVPFFPVFTSLNIARHQGTLDALAGAVPKGMVNVDGSTPFTAAQTGVTATSANHLVVLSQTVPKCYTNYIATATLATPIGIGASSLVDFSYRGPSVPASGATPADWRVAAGVITVPTGHDGDYIVEAHLSVVLAAATAATALGQLRVGGIVEASSYISPEANAAGTAFQGSLSMSTIVSLVAGSTIDVQLTNNGTGGTVALVADADANQIVIRRIG